MPAPSGQLPELRRGLLERLDGVRSELNIAHLNRKIYDTIRAEIILRRPEADALFLNTYWNIYVRSQIMVVRRLAEADDSTDSLWGIIERIKRNPGIATRSAMLDALRETREGNLDEWDEAEAARRYTIAVGPADTPDVERLTAWQAELRDAVRAVTDYADRRVAHRDPREHPSLSKDDVEAALDHGTSTFNQVSVLLESVTTMFDDMYIDADWQACFRPGLFPHPMIMHVHPRSFE